MMKMRFEDLKVEDLFHLPCTPVGQGFRYNMMTKAEKVPKFRNKLNGIIYYKCKHNVKYIDGIKYFQMFRNVNDNPIWIKADILEEVA